MSVFRPSSSHGGQDCFDGTGCRRSSSYKGQGVQGPDPAVRAKTAGGKTSRESFPLRFQAVETAGRQSEDPGCQPSLLADSCYQYLTNSAPNEAENAA